MTSPFANSQSNEEFTIEDDLDEVRDGFHIEPGAYPARVVAIEPGESKAGNPMWTWTFQIAGNSEASGKEMNAYSSLMSNALFTLKKIVKATGIWSGGKLKFTRGDAIGKMLTLHIEMGEWEGKPRPEITDYSRYEGTANGSAAGPMPVGPEDDDIPF